MLPGFWPDYVRHGRLRMNPHNPLHPKLVAFVLDVFEATQADPSATAVNLGVSLRSLLTFLHDSEEVWRAANDARRRWSLSLLRTP